MKIEKNRSVLILLGVILIGLGLFYYQNTQLNKIRLQLKDAKKQNEGIKSDKELFEIKLKCKEVGEQELEKLKKRNLGIDSVYLRPEYRYSQLLNACILLFEQLYYPEKRNDVSVMRAIRLDTNEEILRIEINPNDNYQERLEEFWRKFNQVIPY